MKKLTVIAIILAWFVLCVIGAMWTLTLLESR